MTPAPRWTFAIVSIALFMVVLDNLVVTTALPSIREDLGATIQSLEWTVNAYTLSFAVLLLTGAALGDRFGRRRMFAIGLGVFTAASAAAALAPTTELLIAARAVQGAGAAAVLPLTLTLLSEAFPAGRRGLVIGLWSGISGLGVAIGPLVGGAVVDGISWHWIFWINVPIGLALIPLAARRLTESYGPAQGARPARAGARRRSACSASSTGSCAATSSAGRARRSWPRSRPASRCSPPSRPGSCARRTRCCRCASSARGRSRPPTASASSCTSACFGSIFLLAPFLQVTQGLSPLEAGIRTLPWTGMPMLIAPIAGLLSDRIGARPLMAGGLALQAGAIAWLAAISTPTVPYAELVVPFIMAGAGMALVFAPVGQRGARLRPPAGGRPGLRRHQRDPRAGRRDGRGRARLGVREQRLLRLPAGVHGRHGQPRSWVGAAVLAAGALIALLIPAPRGPLRAAGAGRGRAGSDPRA